MAILNASRYVYPNLVAEMSRRGIQISDIAKTVGKTAEQVGKWLAGTSGDFPIAAAIKVANEHFPGMSVEELFERVELADAA